MKDRSTDITDAADAPWDWARYLRAILRAPVYEAAEHTPLQEIGRAHV